MAASDCRHFNGYKPCGKVDSLQKIESPDEVCSRACAFYDAPKTRVLLIHLGALGAVVRSTALLPAIRRKYPRAHITWVTDAPADVMLREHPLVDRVIVGNNDGLISLMALEFDAALVVDKSLKASGLLRATKAREVYGFIANASGAIEPATNAARESWNLGLSDHLKFNVNRKPETRLMHEALELGEWKRDSYALHLNSLEKTEMLKRRAIWSDGGRRQIVGLNTGCAATIPAKKLSVDGHVKLLVELALRSGESARGPGIACAYVLLGGKEDSLRNQAIAAKARSVGIDVIESATDQGLRDGMTSVAACDVVVTGDSLGMHMALAFAKPVVAWFGPTCAHEIDLYDDENGGGAVMTKAPCAPCWKRACDKAVMCYDQVDFAEMADHVFRTFARRSRLEIEAKM